MGYLKRTILSRRSQMLRFFKILMLKGKPNNKMWMNCYRERKL
jgi:hypothetical protein